MGNYKPKTGRRGYEIRQYKAKVVEWKKTAGPCRKCGKSNRSIECHHTRGRDGKLLLLEEFWIPLCFRCHRWVHDNIEEARKLKLICEKGKWGNEK